MKDEVFWIVIWTIIMAIIASMVLGSVALVCRHAEKMAELGYEEKTLVGSNMTHWQRAAPHRED